MMLTRIFDDRMLRMQRQGKISFYVKSAGEEAVSVSQCMALRDDDMLFPSYRNQGLQITRGRPLSLPDVSLFVQHPGHVQGPTNAGDVHVGGGQLVYHFRQPDDPVSSGRWMGHGIRDQG